MSASKKRSKLFLNGGVSPSCKDARLPRIIFMADEQSADAC